MKKLFGMAVLLGSLVAAGGAVAGERTVKLAVENMTCASCPFIVKQSMAAVPGVTRVDVSLEAKTATVTFDDDKTSADAIAAASTNVGYPAHPSQEGG